MPIMHYNNREVRYRGRTRQRVRRILYIAERRGAMAACEELNVPYATVWRYCDAADISTKGLKNLETAQS